jgi:hypothetical protein
MAGAELRRTRLPVSVLIVVQMIGKPECKPSGPEINYPQESTTGRRMVKVVPLPISLFTLMEP